MRKQFLATVIILSAFFCGGCGITVHRVPPGQSLSVALAKKATAVELPPSSAPTRIDPRQMVEPDLPTTQTEQVADLITQASFCTEAGKPQEAIAAYEEAVKLMPGFAEARYNLAVLYQQVGEEQKAQEAFRKFKEIAQH